MAVTTLSLAFASHCLMGDGSGDDGPIDLSLVHQVGVTIGKFSIGTDGRYMATEGRLP